MVKFSSHKCYGQLISIPEMKGKRLFKMKLAFDRSKFSKLTKVDYLKSTVIAAIVVIPPLIMVMLVE
jgi:hypothetical protein